MPKLAIKFNVKRQQITFSGLTSLGIHGERTWTLAEIAQVTSLLITGDLQHIIKHRKHSEECEVKSWNASLENFLHLCDSNELPTFHDRTPRRPISKAFRAKIWFSYNFGFKDGRCYTCGRKQHLYDPWEVSHVVSHADGGEETLENLRPCCKDCNMKMGEQNLYEFIVQNNLFGPGKGYVTNWFQSHKPKAKHQEIISSYPLQVLPKRAQISTLCLISESQKTAYSNNLSHDILMYVNNREQALIAFQSLTDLLSLHDAFSVTSKARLEFESLSQLLLMHS
jgi:5-methylcytosine-specific restriction endonuclease McrA